MCIYKAPKNSSSKQNWQEPVYSWNELISKERAFKAIVLKDASSVRVHTDAFFYFPSFIILLTFWSTFCFTFIRKQYFLINFCSFKLWTEIAVVGLGRILVCRIAQALQFQGRKVWKPHYHYPKSQSLTFRVTFGCLTNNVAQILRRRLRSWVVQYQHTVAAAEHTHHKY